MKKTLTTSFLFFCLTGLSADFIHQAAAQQQPYSEAHISVKADGIMPFDGADGVGQDSVDNNGRVRNFDVVTYNVEYTNNDADDSNTVLVINLNEKGRWLELPATCLSTAEDGVSPDSEILDSTSDGLEDTLICNLGDRPQGTKVVVMPIAEAVGNNLDTLEASVCGGSDGNSNSGMLTTGECSGPVQTEITASFAVNISKRVNGLAPIDEIDYFPAWFGPSITGGLGWVRSMNWHINATYATGSELLASTAGVTEIILQDSWTTTHNLDGLIGNNIEPFNILGAPDCVPTDPTATYTVVCSQPGGPGTPVTITVSNIDVTKRQLFGIQFSMLILGTDILNGNAASSGSILDVDNTVTVVSANGVPAPMLSATATPNPGAETASEDFPVNYSGSGPGVNFIKYFSGTPSGAKTGQRKAAKGQIIETSLRIADSRPYDSTPGFCDTIDTSKFEFAGVKPPGEQLDAWFHGKVWTSSQGLVDGPSAYHSNFNPVIETFKFAGGASGWKMFDGLSRGVVIEYSDSPNTPDHFSANCDNSHNWVADYNALTGGVSSVTKVRMKWDRKYLPLIEESALGFQTTAIGAIFSFNLMVLDIPATSIGDFLPNVATASQDFNTDVWIDPVTAPITPIYTFSTNPLDPFYSFNTRNADRIEIIGANLGIQKNLAAGQSAQVKPADPVIFNIRPYTNGLTAGAVTLTITDTLPSYLSYVSDDCASLIPGCTVDISGLPTIVWTIPNHSTGETLATFALNTEVNTDATPGTITNQVEITSDNSDMVTNSGAEALEAEESVLIVADAGLAIAKAVAPGIAEININSTPTINDFTFTLSYRNLGGSDYGIGHLIDVLPYNGDAAGSTIRTPISSNYSGDWDLISISGLAGETFEYSTDLPATIQHQPCHPDNWPAGATIATDALAAQICSKGLLDSGGVPLATEAGTGLTNWLAGPVPNDNTVSAVRVSTAAFPAGDPEREITFVLRGYGNFDGDSYCNNFAGQIQDCALDIISNDVCVEVVAGSISGTVWWDLDSSGGIHNPAEGEAPFAGLTVVLVDATGNPVFDSSGSPITTVTDSSGNYVFLNLPSGEYVVNVVPPSGFDQTYDNDDGSNPASFISPSSSGVITIAGPASNILLTDVEDIVDIDFGYASPEGTASVLWNGFCDQQNFISMTNVCSGGGINVSLALYGSDGSLLGTDSIVVPEGGQVDYSVNDMTGFSMFDYGTVELASSPGSCIDGAMGLFTPIGEGQYFTAAIQTESLGGKQNLFALSDGRISNACYAVYNTFQPSLNPEDLDYTTAHWLQLANKEYSKQDFTINRYNSMGDLVANNIVSLNPRGRIDIAAGHEDSEINNYGIVEIIPNQAGIHYTAQLFRYGMDKTTSTGERVSSFSLADNCSIGGQGEQYLTISRGAGASNWLELQNISTVADSVQVDVYSNTGGLVHSQTLLLEAKESRHFDISQNLAEGESGVAKISSSGWILAKSTTYLYRPDGRILTSETVSGKEKLGARASSSYNSFRQQLNWLRMYNVSSKPVSVTVGGFEQETNSMLGSTVITLEPTSGQDLNLNFLLNLSEPAVGRIEVLTSEAGSVVADIIRVQHNESYTEVEDIECFAVE